MDNAEYNKYAISLTECYVAELNKDKLKNIIGNFAYI